MRNRIGPERLVSGKSGSRRTSDSSMLAKEDVCLDDAKQYDIYLPLSWNRYGIERATYSSIVLVGQRLD